LRLRFLTFTDLLVAQLVATELTHPYPASCGSYAAIVPMERIAPAPGFPGASSLNRHYRNSKIEFSLAARDTRNTRQIARVNQFAG